jgi:hypothetical protein
MKAKTILILLAAMIGVILPLKMAFDAYNAPLAKAEDIYKEEYPRAVTADNKSASEGRVFINNLAPNENTPANYVPPSFDPFNNIYNPDYDYTELYPPLKQPNTVPEAALSVQPNNRTGFQYNDTVTTGTEMMFNAYMSRDDETPSEKLTVRWDFESDGTPDTYFSTDKTALHTYKEPGDYVATLEVLDKGGAVGRTTKKIKVVNNTAPFANQLAKIKTGTQETIFEFDTSKSSDSQYERSSLEYRFDWNNDGVFDTIYKSKTGWRHKFEQPGNYRVVMEVKDPEGLSSTWYQDISVIANHPPVASFTLTKQVNGTLVFDASASTDAESPKKLSYRWDFNYSGPDDIVFDTDFTTSTKRNGHYDITGHKTIRLQVKDADGAISEAFMEIDVN